ncbi:hypothetical protein Hanom_Chr14g01264371 [Helianthus anomalus]
MEPEPNVTTLPVDEPKLRDQTASSSSYGAFKNHITGFGSGLIAKIGYVDGNKLGKEDICHTLKFHLWDFTARRVTNQDLRHYSYRTTFI